MRLILIGCEFSGKTTLAIEISKWMIQTFGLPTVRWHNHFVRPYLERHLIVQLQSDGQYDVKREDTPDRNPDQMQDYFQSMPPTMLESFLRHMIWHHLHPSFYHYDEDYLLIDFFYAEAVWCVALLRLRPTGHVCRSATSRPRMGG